MSRVSCLAFLSANFVKRSKLPPPFYERWSTGEPKRRVADLDPPTYLFTNKALQRHEGLTKARSSLLVQARIAAIGLRDFLFKTKALEINTPYCECGEGRETVEHLVVWCSQSPRRRTWEVSEIRSQRDLYLVLRGVEARSVRLARKVIS